MTGEQPRVTATPSLLSLSRAGYDRAKTLSKYSVLVQYGTLVAGVLGTLLPSAWAPVSYTLTLTALIGQFAAWWIRHLARETHKLSRAARRRGLVLDAIAVHEDSLTEADLRANFSIIIQKNASSFSDDGFYASQKPPGGERLRDNVQESAYFSKHLFSIAARHASFAFSIVLISTMLLAMIGLATTGPNTALIIAKFLVVFLGFIIAKDTLGAAVQWHDAARQCDTIDNRIERLPCSDVAGMISVLCDYYVVTATAPPIPTGIYGANRNRLNEEFRNRLSKRTLP